MMARLFGPALFVRLYVATYLRTRGALQLNGLPMNNREYLDIEQVPAEPEPEDERVTFVHMTIGAKEAEEILRRFDEQKKKGKQARA